ncbi:MAG: DUF2961 domain-containing protein [Candidatus Eisenbacteria bacterium]|uniref:DUF2961 domain-containing protein n=1 Tax=Eiseniibacteriota bacterium TaxID=2212470 RepID=A0A956NFJ5_UNCEI|nr:DUF2961 domain-containing protein [Candidatus Eisenbacteria bacterium]
MRLMPRPALQRVLLAVGCCLFPLRIAVAQSDGGYGDYVDWEGWARVSEVDRAGMASSVDPLGSRYDYNHYEYPTGWILSDRDVVAATIHGPGIIYRFWMPHRSALTPFYVRMYFDGETNPRIDSDTDEILSANFSFFSDPLVTTFAGGQVCYEPIAFRDSIRIETQNIQGMQHYYQYSYRTFPPDTEITSWKSWIDPFQSIARNKTIAMFENVGAHPAGPDPSAVRVTTDAGSVPAGGAMTLANLSGSAIVRQLSIRMDGATDTQLEQVRLRVWWDGDTEPSIDVPVGWFFGAGDDREPYQSLPMGTDSPHGFYCYFPMPFYISAHVELMNPLPTPVPITSAVVEYVSAEVDSSLGYFRATARDYVRTEGSDFFEMAEIWGTGHYVGNFLFLEQDFNDDYMLEGDDILVIDGAEVINGTGLEDAYNGGYYYNWVSNPPPEPDGPSPPFAIRPLNGILRRARTASPPFARADQYRWMIADRVSFRHSLDVSIETDYSEVGSRWKSVVFWYALPIPASDAPTHSGPGRSTIELLPIEPNPTSNEMAIRFALTAERRVSLELIDVAGRKVATLFDGQQGTGDHVIRVRPKDLGVASGVYLVRMSARPIGASSDAEAAWSGGEVTQRKVVLLPE